MLNRLLKPIHTILIIILIAIFNSCNEGTNKASNSRNKDTISINSDTVLNSTHLIEKLKPIYRLPDSLLTSKEIQLKRIYLQLIQKHLVVKDNKYKLELSKENFIQSGLPVAYYDEIIKSIETTNEWIKQMNIDSLSTMFDRARQEL